MHDEASFEHIVYVQIIKSFLFMDLSQHSVNDAVVLYSKDFHLGAGNSSLQAVTQVADNLIAFVDNFQPALGAGCRQLEDTA